MEYKRSELLGLSISSIRDGQFAQVSDLIVDAQNLEVRGLLTQHDWSAVAKVIPFSAIQSWNPTGLPWDSTGLRVADPKVMVWARLRPEIEVVLTQPNIVGRSVFDSTHHEPLGQIVDVFFNHTSRVVGYALCCSSPSKRLEFVPANQTQLIQGKVLWFKHPGMASQQAVPSLVGWGQPKPWLYKIKGSWRDLLVRLSYRTK